MGGSSARAYAEALFDAASARNEQMRIREEMDQIVEIATGVPQFLRALDSPMLLRAQKVDILNSVLGDAFSPLVTNLLLMLGRRMKARLVPDIRKSYSRMADACCGLIAAEVTTAVEIPAGLEALLKESLEKRFGRGVRIDKRIDPSVVGGILVSAGGTRMDATIRGGFERIRRALLGDHPEGESPRVQA